jgi:hypothetical protein
MGREPAGVDILTAVPGVEFEAAWSCRIEDVLAAKRAAGRWQDLADIEAF